MQRAIWILILTVFFMPLVAHGEDVKDVLERYEQALREQDSDTIAALMAEDARISVAMQIGDEAPMVISLTRDEFLQQQRALWRFASDHAFSIGKPAIRKASEDNGAQASFTMKEEYDLFQTTLHRENNIHLELVPDGDRLLIHTLRIRTREW